MFLFFDTETTGIYNNKLGYSHSDQPDVVQLAALLTDSDLNTKAQLNCLIAPKLFKEIPEGAQKAHGISYEDCVRFGVEPEAAIALFEDLAVCADVLVGHNIPFDISLLRTMDYRIFATKPGSCFLDTHGGEQFCTMRAMTDICKLPGKRGFGYKWPTLTECWQHMFNEPLPGAHDAMIDVNACKTVFTWLRSDVSSRYVVKPKGAAHVMALSDRDPSSSVSDLGQTLTEE